jgi:hypothetical protein
LDKKTTANTVFVKAGLTEVIQHLYFYQHLCLISADGFQSPAFANTQTVSGNKNKQKENKAKTLK